MKIRVPRSAEVNSAIRTVLMQLDRTLKQTNEQAAKLLRRGDYDGAQSWVRVGTALGDFRKRTLGLQGDWKTLCREIKSNPVGISPKPPKKKHLAKTPLWEFYQPILQALVQAGGEARRPDIEPLVFKLMEDRLQPGDLEVDGGGRAHWQNCVGRTHKQLMKEGWLSVDGGKGIWKVTEKGRSAAMRQRPSATK